MEIHAEDFEQGVRKALADKNLQEGLATFGLFLPVLRKQAAENLPEFEALRDRGVEIKNKVLANLDFYLEQFEQSVERNGGRVHFARDGAEANRIIEGICEDAENKTIIKSKSMVTEELELNHHLEANGYEIFETDLGEYIIQLRDERPSHIVGPALHLDKDQVADTFHEHHQKYGHETRKDTAEELVQEARSVLREPFRNASIGITGANFVVSETGTIILVTNEGNADLSANMPKKHIVVTGIEKVLPTLEDASLYLRLLARSATGQDTSNYTSFFTGPKRKGDEDGPESFDVVLVDNGRSNLLGTEFQDMLRCLRCGSCLNHCLFDCRRPFLRVGLHWSHGFGADAGLHEHFTSRKAPQCIDLLWALRDGLSFQNPIAKDDAPLAREGV